jgi:hypothetical protein
MTDEQDDPVRREELAEILEDDIPDDGLSHEDEEPWDEDEPPRQG